MHLVIKCPYCKRTTVKEVEPLSAKVTKTVTAIGSGAKDIKSELVICDYCKKDFRYINI